MREIDVSIIESAVEKLFISANAELPHSLENLIRESQKSETNETAKNIFCDMCKNLSLARENEIPICQDTGMAVLFIEVSSHTVHFVILLPSVVQVGSVIITSSVCPVAVKTFSEITSLQVSQTTVVLPSSVQVGFTVVAFSV